LIQVVQWFVGRHFYSVECGFDLDNSKKIVDLALYSITTGQLFSIFVPQKLVRFSVFCVQVVPMKTLNKTLLVVLLDLAQNDVPASVARVADELGITRAEAAVGLNELATAGLVRPETVRLTILGLMRAAGLRGATQGSRRVAA
jgi:hypothetical protein